MQLFFSDQVYIWSVSTLIHVKVTTIQINSKLQMKEKYLGKVEFGEGLYFIFLSTQKKMDRKDY